MFAQLVYRPRTQVAITKSLDAGFHVQLRSQNGNSCFRRLAPFNRVPYARFMALRDTPLRDVKILQPQRHGDARGWFAEVFNTDTFASLGLPHAFAQDNQSFSVQGVLRGLHYQLGHPQGKLVRVISGHIWDVAVDLRRDSPDFGRWAGFDLKPRNAEGELELLWIPEGFAHGFLVLSETAEVLYKTTRGYYPPGDRCVLWNDPEIGIAWPLDQLGAIEVSVSAKDAKGALLRDAELP
jgi:dTDP-4-dehydrorhamnose 3,5-epimerase